MKKIKVVSLFSGCGGLDLGFKQSGYEIIWANDVLRDAYETYKNNIGDHIVCADINAINIKEIPAADILIGGPPCQSFSLVGKRDPNDIRSNMVWSYLKVLKHVSPKIFLLENVSGILSAKNPDGTSVVDNLINAFKKIGYNTSVHKLNAADYGVPQRRQRVFIVGNNFSKEIDKPLPTHSEDGLKLPLWVNVHDALSDLSDTSEKGTCKYVKLPSTDYQELMRFSSNGHCSLHFTPYASKKDMELINCIPPGGNYSDVPDEIATTRILNFKRTGGRTTTYGRLSKNHPSYTLNTHFNRLNVGCNIHYKYNRLISLREALRIQSFPDSFDVYSSTKRNYYVQIGNAVPPLLGKAWAKHLKSFLNK
jgi:DNA (cytosine-5)-methyltransferase 1